MEGNFKRVRTKDLIGFLTCPICNKLQKNAVTINECLHTFCHKCIYDKIKEEDLHSCPMCNTDLGTAPLQRLRPDHNMRSLKQSIFASLKRTSKVPEKEAKQSKASKPAETDLDKGPSTEAKMPSAETSLDKDASIETTTPSVPYAGRRKERSLLSLVNPTTSSAATNGRRKSTNPRRFTADLSVIEELPTEDIEDSEGRSNSPLALRKNTIQNKHQKNKDKDPILVPPKGITDLRKKLSNAEDVEDSEGRSNSPLALRKNTIQNKHQKNKGKDPILVPLEGITDLRKKMSNAEDAEDSEGRSNSPLALRKNTIQNKHQKNKGKDPILVPLEGITDLRKKMSNAEDVEDSEGRSNSPLALRKNTIQNKHQKNKGKDPILVPLEGITDLRKKMSNAEDVEDSEGRSNSPLALRKNTIQNKHQKNKGKDPILVPLEGITDLRKKMSNAEDAEDSEGRSNSPLALRKNTIQNKHQKNKGKDPILVPLEGITDLRKKMSNAEDVEDSEGRSNSPLALRKNTIQNKHQKNKGKDPILVPLEGITDLRKKMSNAEDVEDSEGRSNSPLALRKNTIQNKHQKNKGKDPILVPLDGVTDLWKPLNCLVEAAELTRSNRSNSEGIVFKETPISNVPEDELMIMTKIEGKKPCVDTSEVPVKDDNEDCEKGANPGILASKGKMVKRGKRGKRGRKKSVVATSSEGRRTSPQPVVNAATSSSHSQRMMSSIWLSLVASPNQDGFPPLPQIPSCYLMIKDIQAAVSIIRKYLVRKLDLQSEDEVEISMRGLPLPPSLQLCTLPDIWSRTANTPDMTTVAIGSSAKDHVIVLSYGRAA